MSPSCCKLKTASLQNDINWEVYVLNCFNFQCLKPLPKSKRTPSKGGKKERSSSGTARKAKSTKCPEILSDESSSEEDAKKEKDESSEEDKESEEEVKATHSYPYYSLSFIRLSFKFA